MKKIFTLFTLLLISANASQAEIWKCQKEGDLAVNYTDTPSGGPGINCEKVDNMRFSDGSSSAPRSSAPAPSYKPSTPVHLTTKVKKALKSPSPKPPEQKKHASESMKSGSHNSGGKR